MISPTDFYLKVKELFSDSNFIIMKDADIVEQISGFYLQVNEEKEDIYSLIDWWQNLPSHFNDIDLLIEKRRKLAGIFVFLSKYYSDKQKQYCKAYPTRKIKQAKELIKKLDMVDEKTDKYTTLGKSESIALIEVEQEYLNDYALKGEIEGLKQIKASIKETLSAMNQEIADLREIRKHEETAKQH